MYKYEEAEIGNTKRKFRPTLSWLARREGRSKGDLTFGSRLRGKLVVALVLVLIAYGSGGSFAESLALKFVPSSGHECSARNCVSEVQRTKRLARDERKEFTYRCSGANPFLQNWDVSQHRFIYVAAKSFTKRRVTVVAKNYGSTDGKFSVVLGCATRPPTRVDFKTSNFFIRPQ